MESKGEARLETAAIAIADGTPLEWSVLTSELLPMQRAVAEEFRVIAGIAEALNARGLRSARGGRWHVSGVQRVMAKPAL